MSIEERAKDFTIERSLQSNHRYDYKSVEEGYIKGATDQRKIDVDKFLTLLDKAIDEWNEPHRHQFYIIDKDGALRRFRKAMED